MQFIGESVSDDGVMQPGEAWTWECTKAMNADTINTAAVIAVDPKVRPVTPSTTDRVDVFVSEIHLVKDVDPVLVAQGGTTTFTFTVTNPGTVPLSNVTLADNTCSPISFVGGDTNGDGVLAPADARRGPIPARPRSPRSRRTPPR